MKKPKFTFDDQVIGTARIPKSIEKMIKCLDTLEDGKFISAVKLAQLTDYSEFSMFKYTSHKLIIPYRIIVHHKIWLGNKNTVKQFNEAKDEKG